MEDLFRTTDSGGHAPLALTAKKMQEKVPRTAPGVVLEDRPVKGVKGSSDRRAVPPWAALRLP